MENILLYVNMDDEYKELLNRAYSLHLKGCFNDAKILYEKYLKNFPQNPDALNLYAKLQFSLKNYDKALELFIEVFDITHIESIKIDIARVYIFKNNLEKALEILLNIDKKDKEVLNLIASIYTKNGNYSGAVSVYKSLLNIIPGDYSTLFNLSLMYKYIKKYELSLKYAKQAYSLNQTDTELLSLLAFLYETAKDNENLIFCLEQLLKFKPKSEVLLIKLAILNTKIKEYKKALMYYEKCLMINENNFEALVNLPPLLSQMEQFDKALILLKRAYNLYNDNIRVLHSLHIVYFEKRDWENAEIFAKKMIELEPKNHLGYGCLANVYFEAVDYLLAIEYYKKALTFEPDDSDYKYNLAASLGNLNKTDEAEKIVDELLKSNPDDFENILLSCNLKLRKKEYLKAKEQYLFIISPQVSFKFKRNNKIFNIKPSERFLKYYEKSWTNAKMEDLKNKTLLVYNDAGYGDYIMLSRYIPLLKNFTGKVVIEAEENLFDLFKKNFKDCDVILERKLFYKDYDYTVSSMHLLYIGNWDFDHIPFKEGWLNADEEIIKKISKIDVFNTKKIKAGIFWRGNRKILKNRAVDLNDLIPVFNTGGFTFYSLDIADKDETILNIMEKYNIIDCSSYIKTFSDTAAIIKNLDILITIDSSILHLGGALGVKTFLMLPENTEWRWFQDDKTTPWYKSVTIFKQKRQTNWSEVVSNIKTELQNLPQSRSD